MNANLLFLMSDLLLNHLIYFCTKILILIVMFVGFCFFQDEIKYILDNTDITARKFCAVVFQPKCGDWEEVNNWHIDTSHTAEKPEPIEPELPPVRKIYVHDFRRKKNSYSSFAKIVVERISKSRIRISSDS